MKAIGGSVSLSHVNVILLCLLLIKVKTAVSLNSHYKKGVVQITSTNWGLKLFGIHRDNKFQNYFNKCLL